MEWQHAQELLLILGKYVPLTDPNHEAYRAMNELWDYHVERQKRATDRTAPDALTHAENEIVRVVAKLATAPSFTVSRRTLHQRCSNLSAFKHAENPGAYFSSALHRCVVGGKLSNVGNEYGVKSVLTETQTEA